MNIVGAPRTNPSFGNSLGGIAGLTESNAADLNFYSNPPTYELSLDEFEQFALARLKVRIAYFIRSDILDVHC